MDGQTYLIAKIEAKMPEGQELEWLKHISETSLLKIENYPALIIDDDTPGISKDTFADSTPIFQLGRYTAALFVKTVNDSDELVNLNEMTRAQYKAAKNELAKKFKQIVDVIFAAFNAGREMTDDTGDLTIVGISFEEQSGGIDFVEIDSTPVLMLTMPVSVKYVFEPAEEEEVLPGIPTLQFPVDGELNGKVRQDFQWSNSAFAETYEIQITTDQFFASILIAQSGLISSSYTIPDDLALDNFSQYFWRVRAKNSDGVSDWSSSFSFVVNE